MRNNGAKISYLAILVIGLAAFCLSILWYSPWLFGDIWAKYRSTSTASAPMWKFFVAPLRELITAAVVTYLVVRIKPQNWRRSLLLGFVLWFGFYAVQMAGAVIWDNMPWQLGSVHAGDWLMKTIFITIASSEWHRRLGAFG
jgi:hypothetical protein